MHEFQHISEASDHVMVTLVAELEIEFGRGAGEGLARHFLSAEDADFRWECRLKERWIGTYESDDDGDMWLDRIAICGRIDGNWYQAVSIVDGDGRAHGMLGCREFESQSAAFEAMLEAH